jgi:hypothetical protein
MFRHLQYHPRGYVLGSNIRIYFHSYNQVRGEEILVGGWYAVYKRLMLAGLSLCNIRP